MSFIIGSKCIGEKDGACIEACPIDCIYESLEQMFIHPDECIDCGACVPACPVEAIFENETIAIQLGEEDSVHANYKHFGLEYK